MTDPRIALVTGGSRGLGRATSLALAADGTDIILTYRSQKEAADETVAAVAALGRTAVALPLDTADVATFDEFARAVHQALHDTWDRTTFDVLINNAGVGVAAPFAETTEQQFDELFDVHVKGVFFLTQRLLGLLADGGSIVNLATGLTRFTAPGMAAYASAKGAVEVLTRYLAVELGPRGIQVNTIAPGATATEFGGGHLQVEQVQAALGATVALGRIGEAEDIGGAVAALVSDRSHWVNAQRIEVSGGQRV
jgi:NAD(P)-dependent dehydrogenase (short-subunit alcohol dehydrogenase family)